MAKPISHEAALRIIRTWADYQARTGYETLIPADVLRLCDEALSVVRKSRTTNRESRTVAETEQWKRENL